MFNMQPDIEIVTITTLEKRNAMTTTTVEVIMVMLSEYRLYCVTST
jgi:hypothetical protein